MKFSRRREYQLHWAQRSEYKTTKKEGNRVHADKLREKGGCEGRYYCVNLQNENTVEIRIFNGTLREESFIAALELCQTFADYAKSHNADDIAAATWDDVISYDGFDTLKEYCDYRNIDGTTTGDTVVLAPPRWDIIPQPGDLVRFKGDTSFAKIARAAEDNEYNRRWYDEHIDIIAPMLRDESNVLT